MKEPALSLRSTGQKTVAVEHPDLTMQRELARVTALLVGMIRLVEDPALAEFPPGLWEFWEEYKAKNIEH